MDVRAVIARNRSKGGTSVERAESKNSCGNKKKNDDQTKNEFYKTEEGIFAF